jgi:hypothetical protein
MWSIFQVQIGIRQLQPLAQQAFYLGFVSLRVLVADTLTRQAAGQFVQSQCHRRAFLTGHLLVTPDLFSQSVFGFH